MVRLGLIGAGGMANSVHYPSLATMDDVRLEALCDLDRERLDRTAAAFAVPRTFTDYRRMLDSVRVDAVYVLMPPHQLFDLVLDALERGKHVFIEKPPGVTVEQCRQMAAAAERSGVLGMVGFNRRFIPLMRACRDRVLARGPVTQCVASFYKCYRDQPAYYRGATDVLTCDAVHAVDMLRWMGGEARTVASLVDRREADYDNAFNALVRFAGGATGVLLSNWTVGGRVHRFEMHGPGVSAYADPDGEAVLLEDGGAPEVLASRTVAGSEEFRVYYGFEAENRHFIDCIRDGVTPLTSLADAVRTMELVERIYHSRLA
ncbi:MAG: Gfo/Idh/MocA family oxidoreductase [Chthonomonadales bacterium]|nr:Gfo/Idh/MocA family oxidoreductase [Chthonomonadales bacterium]